MTYKRLAPSLLTLILPLSLGLLGCGGNNEPSELPPLVVVENAETGLLGLSISSGDMRPAFRTSVTNYSTTLYAETAGFSVTASPLDTSAKLKINGRDATGGVPFPVDLVEGDNRIAVGVVSEDGRSSSVTALTVTVKKLNTTVYVLDGPGGVPVKDAVVTLTNANTGEVVQDSIKVTRTEGYVRLALEAPLRYHISAKGSNTASATFAWFDPAKETRANLYCLPYFIVGYPQEAPIITKIDFSPYYASTGVGTWSTVPEEINEFAGTRANLYYVRITAIAKNPITEDMGVQIESHKPMRVALDHEAVSVYSPSLDPPIYADWGEAVPVNRNGERYYQTVYSFAVPTAGAQNGKHWLEMVVYDIASNRTTQRLYIDLTDVQPSIETGATGTDSDLYNFKPRFLSAQGHTYGASMNMPVTQGPGLPDENIGGITPVPGYGAHCYNFLTFRLTNGVSNALAAALTNPFRRIRGFEVWRSDGNDQNFRKIDTLSFVLPYQGLFVISAGSGDILGGLLTGQAEQRFRYYDYSPELNAGTTYYYKIRVWNFNRSGNGGQHDGFSLFTDVLSVRPLPAFASQLSAPAHKAVSAKLWPTFQHKTSPELVRAGASSQYRFFLYVKDIADARETPFTYRARIDFDNLDSEGKPTAEHVIAQTVDEDNNITSMTWAPAVYEKSKDEEGRPVYAQFISVADDGTISIDTDNAGFQEALDMQFAMKGGKTYEWSIYGQSGGVTVTNTPTNSSYFYKRWPLPAGSDAENQDSFSFGSLSSYGLGSPNGLFTLTIAPNAN